jgi:SWIM zinc finger
VNRNKKQKERNVLMITTATDSPAAPARELFIVAKSDEGFRVCSALDPARQYTVTGIPDDPQCTCPDFTHPDRPPDWLCKHIQAVLEQGNETSPNRVNGATAPTASRGSDGPPARTTKRAAGNGKNGANGNGAVMLLKRSVSPDGRIDSLSVEFSCPVGAVTAADIKAQATTILALQGEIAQGFLKTNGNGKNGATARNGNNDAANAVSAQLLAVGSMNSRWGRRLFINVLVNGKVLKFFGSEKQLAGALADAGYPDVGNVLADGMTLNLSCRVVTKPSPDGKYTNVERVLPAAAAPARR